MRIYVVHTYIVYTCISIILLGPHILYMCIYKFVWASMGCRNLSTYKERIRLYVYICSTYLVYMCISIILLEPYMLEFFYLCMTIRM